MWLEIDERKDVLSSLTLCNLALNSLADDNWLWKWAILSIHNALQGSMVCHLSGTAQIGALSSKSAEAWFAWHNRDRQGEIKRVKNGVDEFGQVKTRIKNKKNFPPTEFLATPEVLFERLYDQSKRCEVGCGAVLDITEIEKKHSHS